MAGRLLEKEFERVNDKTSPTLQQDTRMAVSLDDLNPFVSPTPVDPFFSPPTGHKRKRTSKSSNKSDRYLLLI